MQLKRDLGLLDVVAISCGAMLSGLFILPGLAYAQTGPSLLLAFQIAGIMALTGMFSQAELVSAMPKAGGAYFFVSRSMGPTVGTVYGLITWLSLCLKSAVELLACAAIITFLLPLPIWLVALLLCLVFMGINLVGVKEAGKIQVTFIVIILGALLLFMIFGVHNVRVHNYAPFVSQGYSGVMAAAGLLFMAFGGLLKVASIAEEVDHPGRTVPLGMIISVLIVLATYTLMIFAVVGMLPADVLSGSRSPISTAAESFWGRPGYHVFALVAVLAILSAANAGILAASRYPLALSRDGLFPAPFRLINSRFNTPHISILGTGLLICAAIFLKLETIVKAASAVLILTYMFSCVSVIIMRESGLQNYQPRFYSPLYPWIQVAGIFGFIAILIYMGSIGILIGLLVILFSIFLYWYYRGIGTEREFALLHLIERITDKDLTSHMLETELKDILHERDKITKDRFDLLIEGCSVFDIERPMTKDEFFELAAGEMAPHLKRTPREIKKRLVKRENESSTVLSPYLAIPHIIIEGRRSFDILLFRCRDGVRFSREAPEVKAVFVLMGTNDMRQMHLMSLAAIAQIVQDSDFEDRWLRAKSKEALRDIILLGKRRRNPES